MVWEIKVMLSSGFATYIDIVSIKLYHNVT